MNWRWIDRRLLVILHDECLAEHGGASGLRDAGRLESALARPLNLAACRAPDIAGLAAACGVDLAKHQAFGDGNKRAAFRAVGLFLRLNRCGLNASQADTSVTMLGVAAGEVDKADFAQWLCAHSVRT